MSIKAILTRFFPRKQAKAQPKRGGLVCVDCNCRLHKREQFDIIAVRHKDCRDPKRVGQVVIEHDKESEQ